MSWVVGGRQGLSQVGNLLRQAAQVYAKALSGSWAAGTGGTPLRCPIQLHGCLVGSSSLDTCVMLHSRGVEGPARHSEVVGERQPSRRPAWRTALPMSPPCGRPAAADERRVLIALIHRLAHAHTTRGRPRHQAPPPGQGRAAAGRAIGWCDKLTTRCSGARTARPALVRRQTGTLAWGRRPLARAARCTYFARRAPPAGSSCTPSATAAASNAGRRSGPSRCQVASLHIAETDANTLLTPTMQLRRVGSRGRRHGASRRGSAAC